MRRWGPLLLWLGVQPAALKGAQGAAAGEDQTCNPALLEILKMPALEQYEACVRDKVKVTNMSIAGADMWVKAKCWCEHNVTATVEDFHCCDHESYRSRCQIQCGGSCSSPEALKCLEECPAMCLEEDYALEGCRCAEHNCFAHTLCITEQGINRTRAGELALVCDDYSFDRSAELRDFYLCRQEQPRRTNWDRRNSASYCACRSNLTAALRQHRCCGSAWAGGTCRAQCLDEAACGTAEAATCLEECQRKCTIVVPNQVTRDCYDHCFRENTTCAKYTTCKPKEPAGFEYLCTSGEAPSGNGCCRRSYRAVGGHPVVTDACPVLCERGQTYNLAHGPECQCSGCPTTSDEIRRQLKDHVFSQAVQRGQELLARIAADVGLEFGPTAAMQELITKRNQALQKAIDDHPGDLAGLEREVTELSSYWNSRLLSLAMKERECQDDPASCPSDHAADGRGFLLLTLAMCFGIFAFMLVLAVFVFVIRSRSQPFRQFNAEASASPGGPNPLAGDTNVVMGRPVEGGPGSAAEGAPVARGKVV